MRTHGAMATPSNQVSDLSSEMGFVFGKGEAITALNAVVADVASTDIPVLLMGESGTGKEIYARLIHRLSGFSGTSLKKINCSSLDAEHLLATIHEGFCSGAGETEGGARTVFLDGVHELDATCQRVLLSLLPDGEPSNHRSETLSRLISSTSRDLEKEVGAGSFRRDLYFRINGVILRLPPLRERKEDIPALLEYFLVKYSIETKKNRPELSASARELLVSYGWPGNIRELENFARKIVAVGDPGPALDDIRTSQITLPVIGEITRVSSLKLAARAASRRTERELILQALERTHWNRKRAARELQISYKSLLYKIKQIGVQGEEINELREERR